MESNNNNDNTKALHVIRVRTIRELVNKANALNIPREDIVGILQETGFYVLIYYYQEYD